ncbi:hypothetical protein J3D55_001757 [Chryseobacterium ginsenosidimutans]|uniref:hypothetical protein n=1 Tax=Chryseobacterium ginsenosidimutans TaxID=687846 RepID=UPI0021673778|nr:hypothetical protein [Chryseobacterium ginsenosidimutans]MCS3868841.1 hypothetical protein [Chryseobacterium ginsenosidimutans]
MKKIYYVPGLISALLIPILFWYYGNQRVHPQYTVVDLGIPPKLTKDTYKYSLEPLRNWNYKKIVVEPNTAVKNQQYYVSELKKLQARNEKETGIEFVIGDKNNYPDFVALIDAMKLANQESYGVDVGKTDHFFAIHFYKDPNRIEKASDVIGGCIVYMDDFKEATLNLIKPETYINHVPNQTYYIIFGFLLFLNISMLSIKERFQLQRFHY